MFNDQNESTLTKIIFAGDARRKLFKGMEIAAAAVGCTLGPKGKTVLIQRKGESPLVTKDGVTVSKSIKLRDPVMKMGADLIREAASQTNEVAGDGTTTATVLTHAMVKEGLKLLEAGYSAQELCHDIESTTELIVSKIRETAKQLTTSEEVAQVGTISANGDEKIGQLIAQAMDKVGKDGIITVEDAKGMSTSLDVVEGMAFDRGYISPYFVTNADRMQVVYQDPYVLVTDKKLSSLRDLIPILEKVVQSHQSLFIIAEDVDGEALQGLVLNKVKSGLPVVAIKAPGYGQHREELLNDICTLTGGKLISSSTGISLEKVTLQDLGRLKKVVVDAKSSTLVGSGATKAAVEAHVSALRTQLEDVTLSAEGITKLKMRIAKLAGGVAIIRVGGVTEVEMVERKYRIEDALNATRAATEEGIVPGGGMALLNAAFDVSAKQVKPFGMGGNVVLLACEAPLRRIVSNAGESDAVVLSNLRSHKAMADIQHHGYDAANAKEVDMFHEGIIDPVKVTITALKNAASVAITFLLLDAVIVEDEDVKHNEVT